MDFFQHSILLTTSALFQHQSSSKLFCMKPELILQSDLLDILFENKNKAYGAYELRKQYDRRLIKSIGSTFLIVLVFALLQSWKIPHRYGTVRTFIPPDAHLTEVIIPREEHPEPKKQIHREIAQVSSTVPLIVEDKMKIDKPVNDIDKIDSSEIGLKDIEGTATKNMVGQTAEPSSNGKENTVEPKPVEVSDGPLVNAEIMPQFPGGADAFVKFMQKNLRQPDDLEDGQKVVVMASFVVKQDGSIEALSIVKQGRRDLDAEVIRVLSKMPKWEPGIQNGRKVPVYFRVPVTFVSAD